MGILPLLFGSRVWYSKAGPLRVLPIVMVLAAVFASPVQAGPPPPTPTLVPPGNVYSQVYQLQEFTRPEAYDLSHTTSYTATVGGAVWVVKREFTYGEAGVTLVGFAIALLLAFDQIRAWTMRR